MRLRIAVTDNDWFRYLRSLPAVDEVNFWQPSGERAFRALEPGELLLFKLHHPQALPTLDAAHIRPVTEGGQHRLDNGLLLRTDVHRLFDKGYVTVTPDGRFLVSRRLKDDFDNGEPYIPFNDKQIWMPGDPASQPNRTALEWHGDVRFLG